MVLGLAQQLGQSLYVHGRLLPSGLPARQPLGDLLQHPAVAIRIAERGERGIAAAFGIAPAFAPVETGARQEAADVPVPAGEAVAAVVHLAHLHPTPNQLLTRGIDVGDDQVSVPDAAGLGRGQVLSEVDRAARSGGVNWT